MLRQCIAGILVGMVMLLGVLTVTLPSRANGSDRNAVVQTEALQLADSQMATIVAGRVNWWKVAGGTLLAGGLIVAAFSGVGLLGAAAAVATGAATTAEVVFAGQAFLAGITTAAAGSAMCDSVGC